MKKINFLNLVFVGFLIFTAFSAVKAQDEMPPPNAPDKQLDRERRPNLMAELSLSPEQRQQIRRINAEKRPLARDARERLQAANKNLDQAIYADVVNEPEIQARLKEVQTAQADLSRIVFKYELTVRKVLTAEQIAKFRDLRERFQQQMEIDKAQQQKNSMPNLKQIFKPRPRQMRPNN